MVLTEAKFPLLNVSSQYSKHRHPFGRRLGFSSWVNSSRNDGHIRSVSFACFR